MYTHTYILHVCIHIYIYIHMSYIYIYSYLLMCLYVYVCISAGRRDARQEVRRVLPQGLRQRLVLLGDQEVHEAEEVDAGGHGGVVRGGLAGQHGHEAADVLRHRRARVPQQRLEDVPLGAALVPELHVASQEQLVEPRPQVLLVELAPRLAAEGGEVVHARVHRGRGALFAGAHPEQEVEYPGPLLDARGLARAEQGLHGAEDPRQQLVAARALLEISQHRAHVAEQQRWGRGPQEVREHREDLVVVLVVVVVVVVVVEVVVVED